MYFQDLAASATPDRRGQVMVGPLPDGFLQIPEQAPFPVHQQQQMAFGGFHQSAVGILNVTVVQVCFNILSFVWDTLKPWNNAVCERTNLL